MDNFVELFCNLDDFCHQFILQWGNQLITDGIRQRRRHLKMTFSERITIIISFHQSNHRDFNSLYIGLGQ